MITRHLDTLSKDRPPQNNAQPTAGAYVKSIVYGGLDGTITTFAVVAGVAGASLGSNVILILGFANLIADGIAMAFGDFLSTRAEQQYHANERTREEARLANCPERERDQLISEYTAEGLSQGEAESIVNVLEKHPKLLVDTSMVMKLGILEDDSSPLGNAIATFLSFALFGFIPLIVFVITHFTGIATDVFPWACALTAATLFSLGALKSRIINCHWWRSGIEILFVGGIAAIAAFAIGKALESLA